MHHLSRSMGQDRGPTPLKQLRDEGCQTSPFSFQHSTSLPCPGDHRQHYFCSIYQQGWGTRSWSLWKDTNLLFSVVITLNISICKIYPIADDLYRARQILPTEWPSIRTLRTSYSTIGVSPMRYCTLILVSGTKYCLGSLDWNCTLERRPMYGLGILSQPTRGGIWLTLQCRVLSSPLKFTTILNFAKNVLYFTGRHL